MDNNQNENNNKDKNNEKKNNDQDIFLASKEENNEEKKNNLNYKNLISHPPKTEIEVLDNIKGDKFDLNFKIIVIGNSGKLI